MQDEEIKRKVKRVLVLGLAPIASLLAVFAFHPGPEHQHDWVLTASMMLVYLGGPLGISGMALGWRLLRGGSAMDPKTRRQARIGSIAGALSGGLCFFLTFASFSLLSMPDTWAP